MPSLLLLQYSLNLSRLRMKVVLSTIAKSALFALNVQTRLTSPQLMDVDTVSALDVLIVGLRRRTIAHFVRRSSTWLPQAGGFVGTEILHTYIKAACCLDFFVWYELDTSLDELSLRFMFQSVE